MTDLDSLVRAFEVQSQACAAFGSPFSGALLSHAAADIAADGSAMVTGYMLVVRYDSGSPVTLPAPFAGVENIRTIRVKLTPTANGWRILNADSDPISFAAP